MRTSAIGLLACPTCGSDDLSCKAIQQIDDRLIHATIACSSCGKVTSVHDGVWHAMGEAKRPNTIAQFSNILPPVARFYEPLWRSRSLSLLSGRKFPIAEELDELEQAVSPGPDQFIVDVACSAGLYARRLASKGATVFCVDHSLAFLRQLEPHLKGLPLIPVLASAQNLPFQTAAMNSTVMGASLNEIGDAATAIKEMVRVTADNGKIFSMSLTAAKKRGGKIAQALAHPGGVDFPTRSETVALFESAGYRTDAVREDGVVLRYSGRKAHSGS